MLTHRTKAAARRGMRTGIAIVLLAAMLFPAYWMLNTSLQPSGNTLSKTFFPAHPSFAGYQTAITDQGRNLVTSLLIAIGTVVVTLVIAAPCAYALAQFRFRWINWALLAILVSQMIPGIVIANALYTLYERIGLLNSIPGLIIANAANAIPFGILIMPGATSSSP
jgi:multiple sugar transport system permease protein